MTRFPDGLSMAQLLQLPEDERLLVNRALRRRDLTLEKAIALGRDRGQPQPEVWAETLLQTLVADGILQPVETSSGTEPTYRVNLAWRRPSEGEWLGFED